ncbi:MAG: pectate lyase [Candidatus Dactylopiibacterium sp.]|nr:pectate lyase [Candidatus Dactylopiibacterium sp.]
MTAARNTGIFSLLIAAGLIAACGGGGGGGSDGGKQDGVGSSSSASSSAPATTPNTVTGWASVAAPYYGATGTTAATTGGEGASSAKTYTVTTRAELIQALYGNTAQINADGSIQSGSPDSSKKIIYVSGRISLNTNKAGTELAESDYICAQGTSFSYNSSTVTVSATYTFDAYKNRYDPNGSWGTSAVDKSGDPLEVARACAAANQKKVVMLGVPSNTSILGVSNDAAIVHGTLVIGGSESAPSDNVVIRNLTFEDAFDFFPQWDPTDSGGRWNSAYDNISVMHATHVWIDHNSFSDGARPDKLYPPVFAAPYNLAEMEVQHHDGLLDITKRANYVTVSWNHFHDHDKTNLIGGTDTAALNAENPAALRITFHNNYWQNIKQRQPRVRYGMVHVFNNYYDGTLASSADYKWSAGVVAGQGGKLYIENNAFALTGGAATAATIYGSSSVTSSKTTSCAALAGMSTDLCGAYAYGIGNTLNGASVDLSTVSTTNVTWTATPWFASNATSGAPQAKPADFYAYTAESAANAATKVIAGAGAGRISFTSR